MPAFICHNTMGLIPFNLIYVDWHTTQYNTTQHNCQFFNVLMHINMMSVQTIKPINALILELHIYTQFVITPTQFDLYRSSLRNY
jgi:hypothetical protein